MSGGGRVAEGASLVALFVALAGCGGRLASEDRDSDQGDSSAAPSFFAADGAPAPAPAPPCVPCAGDADCGGYGQACVALAAGGGYCAPGCPKEGLCTPDRDCVTARSPSGETWRACVPSPPPVSCP
jgi:hypothetical protein